jgi:glyoxylase-like metal-dependent hydrolase (beta-lactamase superfamily II)
MHQIDRGIYYEDSYLGVTLGGMVYSYGTIMVDAPLRAEDARTWRSALVNQRSGINRMLVNLDAHPDRTLGARGLDCTILAHQKTAQVFRNRPAIFKGQNTETGAIWETYLDAIGMRWAAPDITFTDSMSLHWGGPEVVLEHHPGPTPGAIWAVLPTAKVVFVGDLVVINQPPFLSNADFTVWLESLDLLLNQYSDFTIVSGRGGLASIDAVQAQHQFLKDTLVGIEQLARSNEAPEVTEKLIPGLMAAFTLDDDQRERFTQRMHYGLYQYFARRYRPTTFSEQPRMEDSEQ